MYLIRQETNYSLAQIGKLFGNRDPATITNACKKIASELESIPFLQRRFNKIKRLINNSH
jgi:chromosomal replication initiation ATPase DnaA